MSGWDEGPLHRDTAYDAPGHCRHGCVRRLMRNSPPWQLATADEGLWALPSVCSWAHSGGMVVTAPAKEQPSPGSMAALRSADAATFTPDPAITIRLASLMRAGVLVLAGARATGGSSSSCADLTSARKEHTR